MARRSIIWFLAAAIVAAAPAASGQTKADTDEGYVHIKDIPYTSAGETDPYKTERCKLDLYFPEGEEGNLTGKGGDSARREQRPFLGKGPKAPAARRRGRNRFCCATSWPPP